jgi:molybdopterin-guanine dinucleotide biosynthesis protein A
VAHRALTGALLVGGASRRFGSPKAMARFGAETLAERGWRVLGECCDERIAFGKKADALELPFPLVDDGSTVRAPIAGVVAALRRASHDVCVVLPVDCPLVTADDLRALAGACGDAAVPPSGPLPGAYRKRALPVLERALAEGRLALRDAVAELDITTVALPPSHLANVNTPAELEALAAPRIVPLSPERADAFQRFVAASLAEFGFVVDPALDPDLNDVPAAYAAAWLALDVADEVVGSIVLIEKSGRELLLRRMYLDRAYRGRGIGRQLLELALVWAREREYARVLLDTTDAMVAARALYESAGFRPTGEGKPRAGRRRLEYALDLRARKTSAS